MGYQIGTLLNINGLAGKVIGFIRYENTQDPGKFWTEYRLRTRNGEAWLSCDDFYNEYSVSWPANDVGGRIGPEWHKVDEGTQVVRSSGGDVDVDPGESATFLEFEDEAEDHTLSVEMWSDGTEYSKGEYVEKEQIVVTGFEKPKNSARGLGIVVALMLLFMVIPPIFNTVSSNIAVNSKKISTYLESAGQYNYKTSITGNANQTATVYEYFKDATTDDVAKDIIKGVDGNTVSVTQKDDEADAEIAILTKKEYCLIYHPELEENVVYVQISDRKYNYASDNSPYRSTGADTSWYRSHYYSAGYSSDANSYKSTPSAYSMYDGSTVHNIGNGYFDSYSNSIRQSSIDSRNSSSGGISSGK